MSADVAGLLTTWAASIHSDTLDVSVHCDGEDISGPLAELLADAAVEIDRLRDLGLRLYVALRDYRTTDPDAIGALLREVAAGGED